MASEKSVQQTEIRNLKVALTDAEVMAKGDTMSASEIDVEGYEETVKKLSQSAKALKEEIRTERGRQRALSHEIQERMEYRPVECARHFDFAENRVGVARTDTGEIIQVRAMTSSERELLEQQSLFDEQQKLADDVANAMNFFESQMGEEEEGEDAEESNASDEADD